MATTNLARVEGTSIAYLTKVSDSVRQFIRDGSEDALRGAAALMEEKPGLLSRLLPTSYEREKREVATMQLRQIAQNNQAMMALYTEVQLEIARQESDVLITSRGLELGATLAAFAMAKFSELESTIAESQSDFMRKYVPRKAEIEEYRDHPELYDRATGALRHQLDIYFSTTESLLDDFKGALDNKLPKRGVNSGGDRERRR